LARLAGLALAFVVVTGCQNNSERDLIARDRRMQEDQIYALQDYITQYQRLLCQYRSENCALKRQLSEGSVSEPSEPTPVPRRRIGSPPTNSAPAFQSPQTPSKNDAQPLPPSTPPADPPEVDAPEVPPLKATTSNEESATTESLVDEVLTQPQSEPQVLTASYEEPAPITPLPASQPMSNVMLAGEVVANENGGPRLVIDVVPFDPSGRVEPFDGKVSVMLLAPSEDGHSRNLGRWDFGPSEVRAAVETNASEPTMRFYVELPADTQVDAPTELWVRLVPTEGAKLLAHAPITLSHAGVFSSHTNKIWPTEESVVAASYEEPIAPEVPTAPTEEITAPVNEGKWATAEPGKPANLPAELQDESGGGGWRTSSEPIPPMLVNSTAVTPQRVAELPRHRADVAPVASAKTSPAKRPGWSPERSDESPSRVATRPSWSATR
jgi:hypothetical protein